jgi:hypothetical protein
MDYCLSYKINKLSKTFDVSSKTFFRGNKTVLFDSGLFSNPKLLKNGYLIRKFPAIWKKTIEKNITQFVLNKVKQYNSRSDLNQFSLENYHLFVNDEQHKQVVDSFRAGLFGIGGIDLEVLGIDINKLDSFINESVDSKKPLSCWVKKYGINHGKFWIRIVRPNSNDNNPPHKDSHLKRLRKNVNIYLPLAGSNELSSLPLIPKSHLEEESEYIISSSPSFVNGKKNTVPCIVHRNKGLDMICPNPKPNEVLIFTPHLIHGGGVNSNKNVTRVSLEMRFFAQ